MRYFQSNFTAATFIPSDEAICTDVYYYLKTYTLLCNVSIRCYIYVTPFTCCFINIFEIISYRVVVNAFFEKPIVLVLTTLNISNDPVESLVTNWNFTLKRDRRFKFEGDSKSYQTTNKGSIALPCFIMLNIMG